MRKTPQTKTDEHILPLRRGGGEGRHAPGFGRMRRMCKLEGAELAGAYSSFGACVVWGEVGLVFDGLETAVLLENVIYICIFGLFVKFCTECGCNFSLTFFNTNFLRCDISVQK